APRTQRATENAFSVARFHFRLSGIPESRVAPGRARACGAFSLAPAARAGRVTPSTPTGRAGDAPPGAPMPRPALCLLVCVLTFAPSGDDFCLPRLAVPLDPAPSGFFPTDDPNGDFLAPAARPARGRNRGISPLQVALVPLVVSALLAAACATDLF